MLIPALVVVCSSLGVFAVTFGAFWFLHRRTLYVYFNAQDFAKFQGGGGRQLPLSAEKGTFAPYLQHYIDVTKFLITVSAASIAFGNNQSGIKAAKLILAFSILYGALFCALVLYFYDEYGQNVEYLHEVEVLPGRISRLFYSNLLRGRLRRMGFLYHVGVLDLKLRTVSVDARSSLVFLGAGFLPLSAPVEGVLGGVLLRERAHQ